MEKFQVMAFLESIYFALVAIAFVFIFVFYMTTTFHSGQYNWVLETPEKMARKPKWETWVTEFDIPTIRPTIKKKIRSPSPPSKMNLSFLLNDV